MTRLRGAGLIAITTLTALSLTACNNGDSNGNGHADPGGDTEPTTQAPVEPTGGVDYDAIIEAGFSFGLSGGFDPMITTGAVTVAANWHVFEGLTELDPATREVYAALGTQLPQAIDEVTYTVTLRDGAVFHDGTPVTSDDVVFSFERVLDPENNSIYAGFIGFIDRVTAVDETTVEIHLNHPFSLVAERLANVKVVPRHLVEADYEAWNAIPVGTGPFRMISAVPDDAIVFERFDDYSGPRPARAAGLVWNLLSDPAARVTAMSSGTVTAIEDVPYIDIPTLTGTVDVRSVQSFGTLFMMFNTESAPFDDVRVRQAFLYALDMDQIISVGMLGNATAATSFLPATHPNYHTASTVYTHNPELARELLEEAGASGMTVTVFTTDTGWVADVAPLIKESLEGVGINVTLDIAQSGGQWARVDAGEAQIMVAPGDPSVFGNDPDLLMRWWHGDNVWTQSRTRWHGTPGFERMQELLDEAIQVTGSEQQALWNEAFDLLSESATLYPLFHRTLPTAWDSTRLDGFQPLPMSGLSFLGVGQVQ